MKALLSFRITTDHEDRDTPVYAHIKLYNEEGVLIWRIDGEFGDECETLPRPATLAAAKADVRAKYPPLYSPFKPEAVWLC